jgi:hypothetical protein
MELMANYVGDMHAVAWLFQRALAAIYLIAFIAAIKQFPALLGERGLLPTPVFTKHVSFAEAPSIFHFRYSDSFFKVLAWSGVVISLLILFSVSDLFPWWCSIVLWLWLWVVYLSIVNVGQQFYSFGWESMLLEAGFFAAFLGPGSMVPQAIPLLVLRWMLFRVEFGAGLIKLRHDECWRDLTCLYYHHETQPLPNRLSIYFHRLPKRIHRYGVAFSHFVQVIVPWGLFAPQPISSIAGALIISHQLLLIVSGNYAWLNWLTVCLGITAFSDQFVGFLVPSLTSAGLLQYPVIYQTGMSALLAIAVLLSVQPALNLFSKNQLMNFSYNPLHLINAYGAFGTVSRERFEVIIEGTTDPFVSSQTEWKEYEFKAKPGDVNRPPPQVAPYHLRLDWLMWFIPFSVARLGKQIAVSGYQLWFIRFIEKLLAADPQTLRLLRFNPFPGETPIYIRARYYLYRFASKTERKETGAWWTRELIGDYLPPVKLSDLQESTSRVAES